MNFFSVVLLIGAGFLGGLANALAGGASLFTFPALLTAGLSPVSANASNSFALLPANSMAAWVDKEKLPQQTSTNRLIFLCSMTGGILGGALLLFTPAKYFELLVPALIGLATVMFIFGKSLQRAFGRLLGGGEHPKLCAALIFGAGTYGGYFGAGLGVIMMAILGATNLNEMRINNAFKNVLNVAANVAANALFISFSMISWHETLIMILGTTVGGFAGGKLVKILPTQAVRLTICCSGVVMTGIYVHRYWL